MKIGYPCINLSLTCRSSRGFRLASFSRERFLQTVSANLDCLLEILEFNAEHGLLYFRISSDLIPFVSHPVCTVPWQTIFAPRFAAIGRFIRRHLAKKGRLSSGRLQQPATTSPPGQPRRHP